MAQENGEQILTPSPCVFEFPILPCRVEMAQVDPETGEPQSARQIYIVYKCVPLPE